MRSDQETLPKRPHRFLTRLTSATLATVLFWLPAAPSVLAQEPDGDAPAGDESYVVGEIDEETRRHVTERADLPEGVDEQFEQPDFESGGSPDDPSVDPAVPLALPGGAEASAATPQAISIPNAEGSVEGMGESFSPILSSGTATFSVPIAVAPGRAGVQPSLALSYSSTGGNGPVGFGWNLGAPFISRQTDRGLPRYIDDAAWHEEEDRFMYNGGQELVPVDTSAMSNIDAAAAGFAPAVPSDVSGWQQYRARVEGGFMRFFRSPDSDRWIVQSKDGTRFDFGLLPAGQGPSEAVTASTNALERDPELTSGGVFQWSLTRMSDSHGSTVYYLYDQHDGRSYLRDIYYVSPQSCSTGDSRTCASSLNGYGARVHLVYDETRDDVFAGYTAGWRIATSWRLKRVEVTAYDDGTAQRTLVRRYHLSYAADSFHSLLESVQVEGRPNTTCADGVCVGNRGISESSLGDAVVGELLPPMTFGYSRMPTTGDVAPGFGGIDATVHAVAHSPPHSVDEGRSDLFDVNSDGLPDLIVTDPARYRSASGGPAVGVFFNGFTGGSAQPAGEAAHFSDAVPMPMRSDLSTVMNLSNLNVRPMDIDGDGRSDLLHMPRLRDYGWWAPTRRAGPTDAPNVSPADQGWEWTYAQIDLPSGDTDPRIDLGRDGSHIRALDVNNDHLIDVVRTTGTVMQTWINLGFLPGGDGRFGSYSWTGSEYALSTVPYESCLLQGGTPIDFDDPEVRLGDMNGDGLQDIIQMRRGRVIYWPGRGEGVWGTGSRICPRGAGAGRYIEMMNPPAELSPELDNVYLSDVNMDGASDIVQVRFREVDVWFNEAGSGWTRRIIARGTPAAPGFAPRIRFADIDGSSTNDIIWGNAHAWEYIDPAGGQRPRLLVGVDNGLGADTTIGYGSSAEDYVEDLAAAASCSASGCDRFTWTHGANGPDGRLCELAGLGTTANACRCTWDSATQSCTDSESIRSQWLIRSSGSPVVSTVVRSVSTTDRFNAVGRTAQVSESQFAYHDGYYEGIEQEFRGFGAADAVTVGDWNNPTVYSRTHFLQGRRPHSIADDRLADNPNEALKGREVMTEVFDDSGDFLSTSFATITNRHLATGRDGREIHYAFVNETNELRYDTTPFTADGSSLTLDAVVTEDVDASGVATVVDTASRDVVVRGVGSRIRTTFDSVDSLGHVLQQTTHGHVATSDASPIDATISSHTTPVLLDPGDYGAGWLWRTQRTYVTGSGDATLYGDTTNTYDTTTGDLLSSTQAVSSSRTYTFGNEDSNQGGATGFTQTDEDMVSSTVYDDWGNAVESCAGHNLDGGSVGTSPPTTCLRYGYVVYDTAFEQIAVSEHLAASRDGGGVNFLEHTGVWDRGLGAVTRSIGPEQTDDYATDVTYDGLGRLTSVTPPNVAGCSGEVPTTRISYELTTNPASQPVSRVITTTELDCDGTLGEADGSLVSIAYVDGLGRARASLSTGDDTHAWVRSGIATLDKKGSVRRTYQTDFFGMSETNYAAVLSLPTVPYTVTRYDAFGRARGVIAEDGSTTWTSYHSLSTDVCDPLDNDPSSIHYRTCTTARTDGHGRVVDQHLRNRHPGSGAAEDYRLWTYYRPDGAVKALVRAHSDAGAPPGLDTALTSPQAIRTALSGAISDPHVIRTFDYDTAGRRLSSDDPDTDNLANSSEASNSWRYLFNEVGDLVAVRDPRGCGQNFFYDLGGRLVGEQYVSCTLADDGIQDRRSETPPAEHQLGHLIAMGYASGGVDLDVVYYYDAYPTSWAPSPSMSGLTLSGTKGRATAVSDRGQRSVLGYDDRGNVIWTAREMALIPEQGVGAVTTLPDGTGRPTVVEDTPTASSITFDQNHIYERTATFDHAGRPRAMTLPEDPDYGGTGAPTIGGLLVYNRRGLLQQAAALSDCDMQTDGYDPAETWLDDVGATPCSSGDVHTVVQAIEYLRDGLVSSLTYGDDYGATRTPTVSSTFYDVRRRPIRMTTVRDDDGAITTGPNDMLRAVTTVVDQQLVWDAANNLTGTIDDRDPDEWPAGHRPQTTHIRHDALYRVVQADFDYTQSDGSRTPIDDGSDWRDRFLATQAADPMHQQPAPMTTSATSAQDRVVNLMWTWDYLANTTEWTDDSGAFYERSLGAITNGDDESESLRPSGMYLASNIGAGTGLGDGGGGWVEVDYDEGGNVEYMTVHGQCVDSAAPGSDGTCDDPNSDVETRRIRLRADCACAEEQHYEYRWDELNRLDEARRYDRSMGGSWSLAVRQRYRYDSANQRTVKQTLDQAGCSDPPNGTLVPCERIALYVYPGDFERRGLVRDGIALEYATEGVLPTETQYVVAGARTVFRHGAGGTDEYDNGQRLVVGIGDLIQTTSAAFDVRTGAMIEASTYYPNGARETYLNDDGAYTAPEPNGFTGKEGDEEVGLVYFGERYLIPRLGRWASPDPLHVHAVGGGEALNSYHYVAGNLLLARDPNGLDYDMLISARDGGGYDVTVSMSVHVEVLRRSNETDRQYRGRATAAVARMQTAIAAEFTDRDVRIDGVDYRVNFNVDVQAVGRPARDLANAGLRERASESSRRLGHSSGYLIVGEGHVALTDNPSDRIHGYSNWEHDDVARSSQDEPGGIPASSDLNINNLDGIANWSVANEGASIHEIAHQLGLDDAYYVDDDGVVRDYEGWEGNVMASAHDDQGRRVQGGNVRDSQVRDMVRRGLRVRSEAAAAAHVAPDSLPVASGQGVRVLTTDAIPASAAGSDD